jgi:hypothetical protein
LLFLDHMIHGSKRAAVRLNLLTERVMVRCTIQSKITTRIACFYRAINSMIGPATTHAVQKEYATCKSIIRPKSSYVNRS